MKRPSFQFYPGDWTGNSNLRRCTHAEKGAWLEVMCLMHDQEDEYGVLRWPLKEVAQAAHCTVATLKSLIAKGVLKGDDKRLEEAFVYVPRSARKDGEPVTLIEPQDGPLWFSSRMVKDEYVRANAGAATRFGAGDEGEQQPPRQAKEGSERAKLRARVLKKTGGACHHCSTQLGDVWEIDHLMPRSKGGRHTFSNLVPSCVACNQDKSDTLPDDWEALRSSPSRRAGADQGDGSSSSSSSSTSLKNKTQGPPAAASSSHAPRKPEESPPDWHTDGPQDVAPPPAYGSPGLTPAPADALQSREVQISVLLRQWERLRGKLVRATSTDPKLTEWARKGVTDQQLREAYDLAVADRDNKEDASPLNPGFVDIFVAKVLNPPVAKPAGKGGTRQLPSQRSEEQIRLENEEAKRLIFGAAAYPQGDVIDV